jgi:AmmeMemoRadiSam system protein B
LIEAFELLIFHQEEVLMWHRDPVVAGSFYPSNADKLRGDIEHYISKVQKKKLDGEVIGLISPHAGYIYSGPVAAYSYAQLIDSDVEVAVVLAPSHRARFGGASVIPDGIYETPLGEVPIDSQIGEALVQKPHFSFIKEVHMAEHSLEVQVPFLQGVLKDFSIVPIIVGITEVKTCLEIAEEMYNVLKDEDRKFVMIISTDLSHYFPYEKATRIDNIFIENLKKFDERVLSEALSRDDAQACGEGPVLTGMSVAKKLGAHRIDILKYANSGDTAGGKDQVVGYLSAAIVR